MALTREELVEQQGHTPMGTFAPLYNEPVAKKVIGVRLPQSYFERVNKLGRERNQWIKEQLMKAIDEAKL